VRAGRRSGSGVLVALLGPDGCGKSTTTRLLLERFQREGIEAHSAYLGPWGQVRLATTRWVYEHGLVPEVIPWGRWLRQRTVRTLVPWRWREERPAPEHSFPKILVKAIKAQIRGLVYYPLLFRELHYRYRKDVRPHLRRGAVVIAERYAFDLRYIHDTVEIETYPLLRRWVVDLFPRPDLTILLDNEPARIHARKPQLSIEALTWQRESYRRVLEGRPHVVLRTDDGPEEVAATIVARVKELRRGC